MTIANKCSIVMTKYEGYYDIKPIILMTNDNWRK